MAGSKKGASKAGATKGRQQGDNRRMYNKDGSVKIDEETGLPKEPRAPKTNNRDGTKNPKVPEADAPPTGDATTGEDTTSGA